MKISNSKKILAAVTSLLIVASVAVGATMTSNNVSDSKGTTTGVVSVNGYSAYNEGDSVTIEGVDKTLKYVAKDSALANTLIYGTETKGNAYLGPAAYFALFGNEVNIAGNANNSFADVQGRVAANKFKLVNNTNPGYSIHGSINSTSDVGAENKKLAVVIANNDGMEFGNFATKYGKFVVSDASSIVGETKSNGDVYYNEDGIIDFADEMSRLASKAKQLANLPAKTTISDDCVTLTGTDDKLNVFTFTQEQWATACTKSFRINVPADSYIVINVPGANPTAYANDIQLNGKQIGQDDSRNAQLLFNYYEATTLNLTGGNYTRGCTLAPLATVDTGATNGNPHNFGQIIANKITIHREQGYFSFSMPTSYIEEYIAENGENINENYTAHFVYWDPATKSYKEVNNGSVYVPGSLTDLVNAFQAGDTLTLLDGDDIAKASGIDAYKGSNITWEVYTDGQNITKKLSDDKITDVANYQNNGLTQGADMAQDATYTFPSYEVGEDETEAIVSTNVYFVATNVVRDFPYEIELNWADNKNENGTRSDVTVIIDSKLDDKYDISVTIPADTPTTDSTTTIDGVTVDVETMTVSGKIDAGLPMFDTEGNVIDYSDAFDVMVYSGQADSYREYKAADTDINDGKVAIYLEDVTTDITIDLNVIDTDSVVRPGSFEVTIYDGDGNVVKTVQVEVPVGEGTPDSDSGYEGESFSEVVDLDLPMFDEDGNKIDYSGYTMDVTLDGTGYELLDEITFNPQTNTFEADVENLVENHIVKVVVEDDRFGDRFENVAVNILKDGEIIDSAILDRDDALTISGVPSIEDGMEVEYSADTSAQTPEYFEVDRIEVTTDDNGDTVHTVYVKSSLIDIYANVEFIGGAPTGQAGVGAAFDGETVQGGLTTTLTKVDDGAPAGSYGSELLNVDSIPEGFVVKEIKVETTTDASKTGYAGDVIYTVVLQGTVVNAYGSVVIDGKTPQDSTVTVQLGGQTADITTNSTLISDSVTIYDEKGNPVDYTADDLTVTGVPDGYNVKSITVTTDENGDIHYTVTITDKFSVTVLDPKGEVILNGTYNPSTHIANAYELTDEAGVNSLPNGYHWVLIDADTGKIHSDPSTYNVKNIVSTNRNLTLQYVVVKNNTSGSPRIYFNMITYKGSHYIKGNVVSGMMKYDGTTEDFVLEETIGGSDALKADKTNDYFMFSMVLGVDNDNVSKTRFTISTESLGSTEYIYDETVEHGETSNLIDAFYVFGKNTATGKAGEALLGPDPFLNDSNGSNDGYDGYRQVRMVLPAEYANKTLYVNAYYYDAQGNQYLHGNYVLKMSANGFWTLK